MLGGVQSVRLCVCLLVLQSLFLFHMHRCSALPVTVALELQPPCAGNVPDTVICAVELEQEWQ